MVLLYLSGVYLKECKHAGASVVKTAKRKQFLKYVLQQDTKDDSFPLFFFVVCPSSCLCAVTQLKNLDFEELQMRLSALDPMMEREIEELRQRYTAKRQPILDAMDAKKRRQQNF